MQDYDTEISAVISKIEMGKLRNRFVYYEYFASYQYATVDCNYQFHSNNRDYELGDSVKIFFNKQKICNAELLTNKKNISSHSTVFIFGVTFILCTFVFLFRLIKSLQRIDWNADIWE